MNPDVVVAGQGVIGLCSALALAERKVKVTVVGESAPGEASRAAAGMLAPSVERASAEADTFGLAARDRYPDYLDYLQERTGIRAALNRRGILQIALSPAGVKGLRKSAPATSSWLDQSEVSKLEPALSHSLGAVYNPRDGCVDNVALMEALLAAVQRTPLIRLSTGRVTQIDATAESVAVRLADGGAISAERFILAVGAWSAHISGAAFAAAVSPAKGQLLEYHGASLGHVTYGPRGYLVPRGAAIIAGSTMERTGFDASTSETGIAKIRSAAGEILPRLANAEPTSFWAGLRPLTPDLLPLLGPDPSRPSIIYACGHGRNGILMAPLTGDLVADLVTGSPLPHDLAQFRPDRF
ncbi:MAG: FAD-dependent oxidoreductase [Gemmatimonadaceae bacterium]|nr:FAD-dependent oxidoreductase [Gemmatimonadaceae bacterium]